MTSSVLGIVLDADSRVLLVKRRDVPVWVLPGGGVDQDERPEHAVLREVTEETHCTATIVRLAAELSPTNKLTNLTRLYLCQLETGNPRPTNETSDAAFFSMDALPHPFFYIHKEWLQECLAATTCIQKPIVNVTYGKLAAYFLKHPIWVIRLLLSRCGFPLNN